MRRVLTVAILAIALIAATVTTVSADALVVDSGGSDASSDRITDPPLQSLPPPPPPPEATVQPGDTLYALADAWQVDRQLAVDANRDQLQGNPDLIRPGWRLKMPGGHEPPRPEVHLNLPFASGGSGPVHVVSAGPNRFYYGYCTWYVATRRQVTWLGNAIEWWANARAQGQPEGATPRAGSIMVTAESALGHVAYVEAVNGDGSWLVSEMNYRGWAVVSQRFLRAGLVPLLGFIY